MINKNEDFFLGDTKCPIRDVLDRFGDKWSMLVLLILGSNDKMRFSELQRSIEGISQKMLTVTLKSLESDGLLERTVYPEIPPRVEYNLTSRGFSLIPHLDNLTKWALDNMPEIEKSREQYRSREPK